MQDAHDPPMDAVTMDAVEPQPQAGAPAGAADPRTSRRAFLADVGRKAVYVTPVVLTLSARSASASPFSVSCKPVGQACTNNGSCCTNNCSGTNTCCIPTGSAEVCTAPSDCCSNNCTLGACL